MSFIDAILRVRKSTAALAASNNPILLDGEIGHTPDGTPALKIGDGTTAWLSLPNLLGGGGGGVSDGDKGDITVSSGTTVWTVDAGAITLSKMASLTTSTILGRATAGTGNVEALTPAQIRTMLNVADGATANASDASLRDRSTHTGTQAVGTITGLSAVATSGSAADLSAGILPAARFDDASHGNRAGGVLHANVIAAGAAGFMTGADKTKLDGVATGATANSPDATLLARANHTGTQAASTIGNFASSVIATVLTGFAAAGTRTAIVATDTILLAFGKVQKYLNDLATIAFTGSVADLTGTKAQFNSALSDGDFLFVGDAPTAHTHVAANVTDFSAAADARIGAASINALADVIITAPSTGQVVKYNGTNWINDTDATGGGGYTHPNHSGDVTSVGDGAQTIAADAVTNTKLANMAANSFKINNTGAAADPIDGTVAQVKTLLAYTTADIGAAAASHTHVSTDVTDFTESSQDAVGAMIDGTLAYVDATPLLTRAALTGDVTAPQGSNVTTIANNAVTNAKAADMAANSLKGNNTGSAADPADLTVAQVKTLLAYTPADIGAATSAQANATHTGDVTGATALTLATVNANVGSFGLAASVAQFTVNAKGLITAAVNVAISIASAAISDSTAAGRAFLTAATAAAQTALLDPFTSALKGLVPASGGGTTNFLRADGTWAAAGGGSPVTVQDEGSNLTTALGTMNFVGAGVTATGTTTVTVTIPGGGSSLLVENVQSGATYTFVLTDADKVTSGTFVGAKAFTLPLVAVVAYSVGTQMAVRNRSSGIMTVNITGAGTLNGVVAGSFTLLPEEEATLWMSASDVWQAYIPGALKMARLAAITDPTAPASGLLVYNKLLANRNLPTFQGPDARPQALQSMLMRSGTGLWLPQVNSATGPGIMGFTAHTITGFTATARALAATNYFTRHKRLGYVSAATAAAVGQRRVAQNLHTIGSGAGVGGFFYAVRFGIADAAAVSGARMFMGMAIGTATPTNVEPSTLVNCIGMGHGAADTNFKIFYGGSAAQTAIDLGANFPSNTLSTDAYELVLFAPPNTQTIHYQVTRLNTGQVASGTLSGTVGTAVPSASQFLAPWGYRTNNATALAVAIDVFGEQIEDVDT